MPALKGITSIIRYAGVAFHTLFMKDLFRYLQETLGGSIIPRRIPHTNTNKNSNDIAMLAKGPAAKINSCFFSQFSLDSQRIPPLYFHNKIKKDVCRGSFQKNLHIILLLYTNLSHNFKKNRPLASRLI